MVSITTKRGDHGQTSLRDGSRVSKDDARVELNGEVDELNALLGLCKVRMSLQQPFEDIQLRLMDFMAVIADNRHEPDTERIARLVEATARMEHTVDDFSAGYRFHFVLPGTDLTDALLHLTRAKVRTCERRLTALQRLQPVPEALLVYMNRLSDFIFCLIEKRSDTNK